MNTEHSLLVRDETEMHHLGAELIRSVKPGMVITLQGDLGTGKTTLVRGALHSLGVRSGVRSPTYTLVEYYPLPDFTLAHFDLYRLADAEELEYLGYRDYLNQQTICIIEWPERAGSYLKPDLQLKMSYDPEGRRVKFEACSKAAMHLPAQLAGLKPSA